MIEFLAGVVCTYAAASAYLVAKVSFSMDPTAPKLVRAQAAVMTAIMLPVVALRMAARAINIDLSQYPGDDE